MKNIIFLFALILVTTSCNKWKGDKHKSLTYYSEDYKEKDLTILGFATSDIDALWVEFSSKDKNKEYDTYVLIAKANGQFSKEIGTCQIDWKNQITFTPNGGESYLGSWIYEKEKYTISYDSKARTEVLTFVYKETGMCKK